MPGNAAGSRRRYERKSGRGARVNAGSWSKKRRPKPSRILSLPNCSRLAFPAASGCPASSRTCPVVRSRSVDVTRFRAPCTSRAPAPSEAFRSRRRKHGAGRVPDSNLNPSWSAWRGTLCSTAFTFAFVPADLRAADVRARARLELNRRHAVDLDRVGRADAEAEDEPDQVGHFAAVAE